MGRCDWVFLKLDAEETLVVMRGVFKPGAGGAGGARGAGVVGVVGDAGVARNDIMSLNTGSTLQFGS